MQSFSSLWAYFSTSTPSALDPATSFSPSSGANDTLLLLSPACGSLSFVSSTNTRSASFPVSADCIGPSTLCSTETGILPFPLPLPCTGGSSDCGGSGGGPMLPVVVLVRGLTPGCGGESLSNSNFSSDSCTPIAICHLRLSAKIVHTAGEEEKMTLALMIPVSMARRRCSSDLSETDEVVCSGMAGVHGGGPSCHYKSYE